MAELGQLMTPVGRLVQGHPITLQQRKDDKTGKPRFKEDGVTPDMQLFYALAFRKDDPQFAQMWAVMQQVAQRDWPKGEYAYRDFAWKLIDGDGVDSKNRPYSERPGFKGCYVIRVTSGYAAQCVADDGVRIITNPDEIKRGYYGRAYVTIRGNGPVNQSPGLYINPSFFQLCAAGEVISSGPDIAGALASAAPIVLPPGATAMPMMGGAVQMPGNAPGLPGMTMPGVPALQPQMPVAATPGLPGMPANGGQSAPALPGMPTAAPSPAAYGAPPSVPGVPVSAPPPPPLPAAAFPPAGWLPHPSAPGYFYSGNVVKTEADLRAMMHAPNPAILMPQ